MENNVFLIKWYGPFKSTEKVEEWEKEGRAKQEAANATALAKCNKVGVKT